MQCSEHNKYQQMNIIMVKCSGMESRMTRGRIIGNSTRTPKEEKPSKPFIPFRWLALPKTLHWKLHTGKLMSREGSIQGCISSKPPNYVSPVDFFFLSPYFIMHFFTYHPGCNKERNLAFRNRIPSCGQWGNQMPIRVLHQSGET